TDIANITRKWPKPDKNGHEIGKSADLEKNTKKWTKSDKIEHEIEKSAQKPDSKTFLSKSRNVFCFCFYTLLDIFILGLNLTINAHIPKVSALASTYLPPLEDSPLAQTGDMAMFMDWFYKRQGITKLKPEDLEGHAFELVKVIHLNVIHLRKPLPLGGPPGRVTIQSDFFNKDFEYLRYGSKGSRPVLLISKMKAAYYDVVGLEKMVPDQMWIEEECKHTSEGDCRAVRTHIWILSVVRIEVFSMYGYDYMKRINLRHLNRLPPKDKKIVTTSVKFWTRHLVISQRVEDFQLEIESYQTQLNLTKPRWDARALTTSTTT
nr:hypothetical protein [Tanacetum cinerariifolium]GEY59689.1 hypothetical protein [Tanacetum cinerariifolium]